MWVQNCRGQFWFEIEKNAKNCYIYWTKSCRLLSTFSNWELIYESNCYWRRRKCRNFESLLPWIYFLLLFQWSVSFQFGSRQVSDFTEIWNNNNNSELYMNFRFALTKTRYFRHPKKNKDSWILLILQWSQFLTLETVIQWPILFTVCIICAPIKIWKVCSWKIWGNMKFNQRSSQCCWWIDWIW